MAQRPLRRGMEVFADLIRVPVWEIGTRSFKIQKEPPMISSACVVFAKSEVIGLLEAGMPENDIWRLTAPLWRIESWSF
jgi:activator of 2-hydroxyglutaryl-CoA dehydratase